MAMLNATTNYLPKPHLEAVQSVTVTKMTDPRLSRRVSVTDAVGFSIFSSRFHVILYYKKVSSEDSGRLLAGWTKESLGRALQEEPMLAGRLRRGEEAGGAAELEIVSNDSGVRLFEARISKTLAEFLDLKEREDAESELVFWNDLDEQNPQFSPLFYIQVTNFQCDGYSVGISCSLLLADPSAIICFLRRWASIHSNMVSETEAKMPIFYLPNLKPKGSSSPTNPTSSNQIKHPGKPLIFKTASKKLNPDDDQARKALAVLAIAEAERELGVKMASKFSLLTKSPFGVTKVENFSTEEVMQKPSNFTTGLTCASSDDLGASEVSFYRGNKPVRVSYWINSVSGQGLVILIPSADASVSEMNIVVSVPSETEM